MHPPLRHPILNYKRSMIQPDIYEININEELGVLTWGDEIDIAPETLYAEATQSPLPDWVDSDQNSLANRPLRPTA
jgi:hypothetical protein